MELRIENFSLESKVRILAFNFYKISPFYFLFLCERFNVEEEFALKIVVPILIIFGINIASYFIIPMIPHLYVFKYTSLIETLLKIEILDDEKPTPLMRIPRKLKLL